MHHLILGYGYCGYYLAQELLNLGEKVTVVSRHSDSRYVLPGLTHVVHDLNTPFSWNIPDTVVYYLIPPPSDGEHDLTLQNLLQHNAIQAQKIVYFGSSGVYGNHQGKWVTEDSHCHVDTARQKRRLCAESQWLTYSKAHQIDCILLRISGIYGPHRVPITAALARTSILRPEDAPWINHIFVRDLVKIALDLVKTPQTNTLFNVSDGCPEPMGALQNHLARLLGVEPAPQKPWKEIWAAASPMKQEFMTHSKRLDIQRLKQTLFDLEFTPIVEALKLCMINEQPS